MSKFDQIREEVFSNSYLKEWYEKVQKKIDDYRPQCPQKDDIIETVANQMLKRCGEDNIPKDDDIIFFTKILWVALVDNLGDESVDEFCPQTERNLCIRLHREQVKIMMADANNH